MGSCLCKDTPNPGNQEFRPEPTQEDYTVANLKEARDQLYFKRKTIEDSISKTQNEIKEKIKTNQKLSARFALQKKKLFEEYLQQLDNKYLVIVKMIQEVDKAMMDRELVGVMRNTNKLLIDMQNSIDLNEMEKALNNMKETEAQNRQFNQLFHEYKIIDDDLLDQEMRRYEEEVLGVTISQQNFTNNNNYNVNNNIRASQNQKYQNNNNNSGVSQSQKLASLL